jgi:hypothetical protein
MNKSTRFPTRPKRPQLLSELGKILEKRSDLKEATLKKLIENKKAKESISLDIAELLCLREYGKMQCLMA